MGDITSLLDTRVRLAAFKWLEEQTRVHGDVLQWSLLQRGFEFEGQRVPLVSLQGIFKPQVLPELPLSIRTSATGPYDDHFTTHDLLIYSYRGTDPGHHDNRGLREAMRRRTPLVYFHAVMEGRYLAVWPVFVVDDDPGTLRFMVSADEITAVVRRDLMDTSEVRYSQETELRRRYVTRNVRQRLHQRGFRERVLAAYRQQCALCHLRHPELLEAAHIIPDALEAGEPLVRNGLALCRLHHGAFDAYFIAVRPDYTVEVRRSILDEADGPMLRHGLQSLHNQPIWTPPDAASKPDKVLLEQRLELFHRAV